MIAYCGPGRTPWAHILLTLAGEYDVTEVRETAHLPDTRAVYLADPGYDIPLPPFEFTDRPARNRQHLPDRLGATVTRPDRWYPR
jgi:hypothetical protein